MKEDGYDTEEAWKYAVNKRKYIFDRILKEFDPPEMTQDDVHGKNSDVEEDDDEQEELPPTKQNKKQ